MIIASHLQNLPGKSNRYLLPCVLLFLCSLSGCRALGLTDFIDAIISITSPSSGATFSEGQEISFKAVIDVHDQDGEEYEVVKSLEWKSDKDGVLAREEFETSVSITFTSFSTSSLSQGWHEITLSIYDDEGDFNGSSSIGVGILENDQVDVCTVADVAGTWTISWDSDCDGIEDYKEINTFNADQTVSSEEGLVWNDQGWSVGDDNTFTVWWTGLSTFHQASIAGDCNQMVNGRHTTYSVVGAITSTSCWTADK
jgi:hypothetical protein